MGNSGKKESANYMEMIHCDMYYNIDKLESASYEGCFRAWLTSLWDTEPPAFLRPSLVLDEPPLFGHGSLGDSSILLVFEVSFSYRDLNTGSACKAACWVPVLEDELGRNHCAFTSSFEKIQKVATMLPTRWGNAGTFWDGAKMFEWTKPLKHESTYKTAVTT